MKLFSGIQPTNGLHLGNYLGAVKQWIALQETHEAFYVVVDLHAMTSTQDPQSLRVNSLATAAAFVALGVDPKRSPIFIQSHIHEHAELAWILSTIAKIGELDRMTQFKDKAKQNPKNINVGLYTYPVLMAADILLYSAEGVPVGADQKQHIELARDIAKRFNARYGDVFTVPEPLIQKAGARIMSLSNPKEKMSKSASSPASYIALMDDPKTICNKIKRAVTDSGDTIIASPQKPALTNLLTIYSLLSGKPVKTIEKAYTGKGYGDFKNGLADVIIEFLAPFQERMKQFKREPDRIVEIITHGAKEARPIAEKTMERVRKAVGLV
jgi:tryptophanyl-tRNA synthetase